FLLSLPFPLSELRTVEVFHPPEGGGSSSSPKLLWPSPSSLHLFLSLRKTVMAAAEARAAWQRIANRCFVQEDAKRAPKLAYCPSSSSKLQPDSSSGANGSDPPASNFSPFNWNSVDLNLLPVTKWWLQLEPNFGYQSDVTYEQLSASEEVEVGGGETVIPTPKVCMDSAPTAVAYVGAEKKSSSHETPWMVSTSFVKRESESRVGELKTGSSIFQQQSKPKANLSEPWYQNDDLIDWKTFDHLIWKTSEKEPSLVGCERTEPWWRIADKDELASFVAQKSLENFENCDLPPPQRVHFWGGDPLGCLEGFDDYRLFASCLDKKLHAGTCYPVDCVNNFSACGNKNVGHQASGVKQSVYGSTETYSGMHTSSVHSPVKDPPESKHRSESDSAKAELLEALHHSQNRAREAEMAAQLAYIEKEHIVKLFFKQASYLFVYKQWIRMLQLESRLLQLKIKEHGVSSILPSFSCMPQKGSQFGRDGHTANKKGRHRKCDVCWYAVAFAVGLGLVSAGLLFGWTLGWLLPIF
ncbi:hypothetical protein Taro_013287, partial [Colocasia esculenta]|nr:hypothetical protein [Colocasia esculenta]